VEPVFPLDHIHANSRGEGRVCNASDTPPSKGVATSAHKFCRFSATYVLT